MRRRGVYLMLAGLVVAGVLVVVFRNREWEPEYGGKRLSEWVGPRYQRYGRGGVSHGLTEPAEEAVRRMGTNAIPFLMKWMRYEMPNTVTWRSKLDRAMMTISHRLNRKWLPLAFRQHLRSNGAVHALIILAAAGQAPIPELTRILNDPRATGIRPRAAEILSALGKDGIPHLLSALTNTDLTQVDRMVVFDALEALGTNAEFVVPALQSALKDPNLNIRIFATNALWDVDPEGMERARR